MSVRHAGARVVTIVGAGGANLKSTVAANLAAALAALDVPVALADADGASSRALAEPLPWAPRAVRLVAADTLHAAPGEILVVDPPARLGPSTTAAVRAADLVLVPVDATPLSLRVLRDVAALVDDASPAPRLRAALARLVPREADRWGLVEKVDAVAPGALLHATLPMARSVRVGTGAPLARPAMLFAPGTSAARAYAALARELLDVLSSSP
ncbi:Cobyrinic acid ac-diamide synthase [Gemmatirosa kalamazoonensis]|uniref:Cobyrinic acid ac-diamide synthase n=1 Tax=Gemmatirosa kalamazoonensis TaxID=861299 RepID=W0RM23_9BACT|nr:Cobyrinic acid ac-diamide synthase [Gemmatirosa kalamazoonensis]